MTNRSMTSHFMKGHVIIKRFIFTFMVSSIITGALFYMMQAMVTFKDLQLDEDARPFEVKLYQDIEFKPPQRPITILEEPEIVEVPDLPPLPQPPETDGPGVYYGPPPHTPDPRGPTVSFPGNGGDTDMIPLVRVRPQYPRRALERSIEGYVVVEFSVLADGSVADAVVIEASPEGIFDKSALNAISKFRYQPRINNGIAENVQGVRNKMVFTLGQ